MSVGLYDNVPKRCFSDKTSFERVTSYETLVARISNANDHNDLVNIATQNMSLFKNEHIVLTLRIFARLMKGSPNAELYELVKDERFKAIIDKAQENIEQLTEYGMRLQLYLSSFSFLQRNPRSGLLDQKVPLQQTSN